MSKALFAVANPLVETVLRSPLHPLMSRNTIVLEFRGRKSGKRFTTPVSYHEEEGRLHCFTDPAFRWWRNLREGAEVRVLLRGEWHAGKSEVFVGEPEQVREQLRRFLEASPRDAAHSGVRLDEAGRPVAADLDRASESLVFVRIERVA